MVPRRTKSSSNPQQPHVQLLFLKPSTTSKSSPNKFLKVDSSSPRTLQIFADAKETKPWIAYKTYYTDNQADIFTDDKDQCDGKAFTWVVIPCILHTCGKNGLTGETMQRDDV